MKDTGFFTEFKKFISRGNVLDMAVGVVIGGAFTAIVNSLVNDLISPVIGLVTGGVDFEAMKITLVAATATSEAVTLNIGNFINAIIKFLLVALVLFCIVKAFNKMNEAKAKKEAEEKAAAAAAAAAAVPPAKPADIALLEEIRDLLKKN